eukprot:TRINITY_DN597_c0_g1_i1.p1 TRINITY_DN597_c0_g1~~TRINITY_DN597_c0_g1_i1.p1  ORF type:complete len:294 (+),score=69.25 TRINITY_DN597_c0_g1_i1:490-1371(+)
MDLVPGDDGSAIFDNVTVHNMVKAGQVVAQSFLTFSDVRLKDMIGSLDGDVRGKLFRLGTYLYKYKAELSASSSNEDTRRVHIGLLAQEVLEVFPEAVLQQANGFLAVDYTQLVPVLILSQKQQQQQLDTFETNLHDLQGVLSGYLGSCAALQKANQAVADVTAELERLKEIRKTTIALKLYRTQQARYLGQIKAQGGYHDEFLHNELSIVEARLREERFVGIPSFETADLVFRQAEKVLQQAKADQSLQSVHMQTALSVAQGQFVQLLAQSSAEQRPRVDMLRQQFAAVLNV